MGEIPVHLSNVAPPVFRSRRSGPLRRPRAPAHFGAGRKSNLQFRLERDKKLEQKTEGSHCAAKLGAQCTQRDNWRAYGQQLLLPAFASDCRTCGAGMTHEVPPGGASTGLIGRSAQRASYLWCFQALRIAWLTALVRQMEVVCSHRRNEPVRAAASKARIAEIGTLEEQHSRSQPVFHPFKTTARSCGSAEHGVDRFPQQGGLQTVVPRKANSMGGKACCFGGKTNWLFRVRPRPGGG